MEDAWSPALFLQLRVLSFLSNHLRDYIEFWVGDENLICFFFNLTGK